MSVTMATNTQFLEFTIVVYAFKANNVNKLN